MLKIILYSLAIVPIFLLQACNSVKLNSDSGSFDYLKYESENKNLLDGYERFYICRGHLYTKSYLSTTFNKSLLQVWGSDIDVSVRDMKSISNSKKIGNLNKNSLVVIDTNKEIRIFLESKKHKVFTEILLKPEINNRTFLKIDLHRETTDLDCSPGFCYTASQAELIVTSSADSSLCNESSSVSIYEKLSY